MTFTYSVNKLVFVFEEKRSVIHTLAAEFENLSKAMTFVSGQRIEMHDDSGDDQRRVTGKIEDVDHFIKADATGNFIHTVRVRCIDSRRL